jgi:hypothetical protein
MALILFENSYLESADDYLADNPFWEAADSDAQEQALVDATRILDQNEWIGTAVTSSQSLAWPRAKLSFFDPVLSLHVPCEQGEIPIRLQKAVAYLALHLLKYPTAIKGYDVTYDSISIGPISLSNTDAGRSSSPQVPLIPAEVNKLIAPLIFSQGYAAPGSWWRAN